MAKKNQPSEPISAPDIPIDDAVMNDPALAGLKDDKQYTQFNAHVVTNPGGVIPEIPEQETTQINVDFTDEGGSHNNNTPGRGFMKDPEDTTGAEEDISDDTKIDLAVVVNDLMFQGLDLLNDFIVKKLVVNEEKLKQLAIAGEIPFEIIQVKAQFGANFVFDMSVFLSEQEEKTRKALEFKAAEKKHISQLLEKAMKSKKLKMSPEWALVASLAGHYGAAMYVLFMNNMEVMKMVELISERFVADKEAIKGAAGQMRSKAKKQTAETVSEVHAESVPDGAPTPSVDTLEEMREPGEVPTTQSANTETGKPRNGKRRVAIPEVEDATLVK
jgi:hypothetical protein